MSAIKILSVDDEAAIERLMKQYFRRKIRSGEYEFFFAYNGLEALSVLSANPDIEVILCDINMPEMDGLTLLAKVNEMRKPALKVIIVSAYSAMENIRQAMNDGAFDFATKPIDMDDLARTIEKAIKQIDFIHEAQKEHTLLELLKEDLTAARKIQQFILPRRFPPFPEESERWDIFASMEAANDIGGDFYDFFRIDDDHIALVIADVCDKGIPAALFMAVSRTIIHSKGMQGVSARTCLTEVNRLLCNSSADYMFVTVFYAVLNTKTGLVTYCNAGHNPPHIVRAGGTIEKLPMDGNFMVGAFADEEYMEKTLQLEHGDTLVMFTDGVTEAMDSSFKAFGKDRLDVILSTTTDQSSQEIVEAVKAGIADFVGGADQSDDITMLVLKRK